MERIEFAFERLPDIDAAFVVRIVSRITRPTAERLISGTAEGSGIHLMTFHTVTA